MTYKRRYLSGQAAVTVDIADRAVTQDKLSRQSVGNVELKSDAVTSDKIKDGAVDTQDIKAGAVHVQNLAPNSVSTEKIIDKAVTLSKLADDLKPSARPLTPGVSSAEISNAAVIASKIAPSAVETAAIKPGACSTLTIAHDAITDDKIADDAVQSEHIENGAVVAGKLGNNSVVETNIVNGSVTNAKIGVGAVYGNRIPNGGIDTNHLATDSVATLKIQDDAVTERKLAAAALSRRHWNSLLRRECIFQEDFGGAEISNRWVKSVSAGGLIVPAGGYGIKLATGALSGDTCILSLGGNSIGEPRDNFPYIEFMIAGRPDFPGNLLEEHGLWKDWNNMMVFKIPAGGGPGSTWHAWCQKAGVFTDIDTGILVSVDPQSFRIEYGATVKFYIDDALVAEISTNIPNDQALEPRFYIITGTPAVQSLYLKGVNITALRAWLA